MGEILSVRDLGVGFGGKPVLQDISFAVEAGESVALIGPNGAGKTVLLRALLGLVRYHGEIHWQAPARLGYVPQKIDADRHLPVHFGNLLAAKAAEIGAGRDEVAHATQLVGLTPELLATPVGKLSGGQFQRALLAFALLGRPNVLLLDEPTASLDEPGQEHIYALLDRLCRAEKLTLFLVSHDLSLVYGFATRVICLNQTLICSGPPRQILTPAAMEQLFGGPAKFYHTVHNEAERRDEPGGHVH